jgi:hypothetical protein
MIRHPAYRVRLTVHPANDSAKVSVNAFTLFPVEPPLTVFGAEDEMIVQ